MKQSLAAFRRRVATPVLISSISIVLAGCGMSSITSGLGGGMFGGGSSQQTASGGVSEEELLKAAKASSSMPGTTVTGGINPGCPHFTSKPTENNITFYEPGRTGDALAVMQRGEITKTARECHIGAGQVTVKYGFSGRVLLGPRGQSGTVTLPVNVMVTDGQQQKIAADSMKVNVAVAVDNPIGYFSAVREISFPLAQGTRPGEYAVYVGFEQQVPAHGSGGAAPMYRNPSSRSTNGF